MSTFVGQKKSRWFAHRITAHRMSERGQSLDVIADHLRVSVRSVNRYLELPCPEPPEPDVELGDFLWDGACGAFPELNWQTRSTLQQADCKAVCAHCPVLAKCRTYGLGKGRKDIGIWGGLTKNERDRMSRQAGGAARAVSTDDDDEWGVA